MGGVSQSGSTPDSPVPIHSDYSFICSSGVRLSHRPWRQAATHEVIERSERVSKLNLYREAGVRECWVCDPQRERVVAYRSGTESVMDTYAFSETVPAEALPGFEVNFGEIVARM